MSKPKPPKGWFDLRSHMCKYIGKRLRHMAEHGQTHPHDVTYALWVETLLKHGTILLYHGTQDGRAWPRTTALLRPRNPCTGSRTTLSTCGIEFN